MFESEAYQIVAADGLLSKYRVYEDGNHILTANRTFLSRTPSITFSEPDSDESLYKAVWDPSTNTYRFLTRDIEAEMYSVSKPWSSFASRAWEVLSPEGTAAAYIRDMGFTRRVSAMLRGARATVLELQSPGGETLASLAREGSLLPRWTVTVEEGLTPRTSTRMAVLSTTALGMRLV